MGLFKKIAKLGVDLATIPIDVARDAVTMGGLLEDKDETNTMTRLKKVKRDGEQIYNELEDD